jgi:hypothetical protein
MVVAMMAIAHVTFNAIFYSVFHPVQQHLAADYCRGPAKSAHRIFSTITLQEATHALLSLYRHISRCRHYTRQVGAATGAIRCAHRCHCLAGWTAQHHRWLAHHGLWLIPTLSILRLPLPILLRVLRLSILLWVLRLLILRLRVLRLLGILARLHVARLSHRGRRKLIAATSAELYTRSILAATVGTKCGSGCCSLRGHRSM